MAPLFSDPLPGNLDFRAKGFLSSSLMHPKAINLRSNSGEVPATSSCAKKQAARHLRLRFEQHSDVSSPLAAERAIRPRCRFQQDTTLSNWLTSSVLRNPKYLFRKYRVSPIALNLPRGERSDMGLPHILNFSKFTSFARADRSDILLLFEIHKPFKFVKSARGDQVDYFVGFSDI